MLKNMIKDKEQEVTFEEFMNALDTSIGNFEDQENFTNFYDCLTKGESDGKLN